MMTMTETMDMPTRMRHSFGNRVTEPSRPKSSKSTTKTHRAEVGGRLGILTQEILAHGKLTRANTDMRSESRFWLRARLSLAFTAAKGRFHVVSCRHLSNRPAPRIRIERSSGPVARRPCRPDRHYFGVLAAHLVAAIGPYA